MNPIDAFRQANGDVLDIWTAFPRAAQAWYGLSLAPAPALENDWLTRVEDGSERPVGESVRALVRLAAMIKAAPSGEGPFVLLPALRLVDSGRGMALFADRDGEGMFFGIATSAPDEGEDVAIYSYDHDLDPDEIDPEDLETDADGQAVVPCQRELNATSPEAFALDLLVSGFAPEGALHLIGCCDEDEADDLDEEAQNCLGPPVDVAETRLYGAADLLVKCRYAYPLGYEVHVMARHRRACDPLTDAFMRQIGLSTLAFDRHEWAEG